MGIRLESISKRYKRNNRETDVLNNLNIDFPFGKFVVLSGESGTGKSTLLNIISGLIRPTEGKVYFEDNPITDLGEDKLSDFRSKKLGIVTQNCELVSYLTVLENLKLSYRMNKGYEAEVNDEITDRLLEKLGLSELKNEYQENLSSGEIKRAAIARGLIADPEVIIMDEPTANLDRKNVVKVLELLKEYKDKGSTVIISSHENQAVNFADVHINMEEYK